VPSVVPSADAAEGDPSYYATAFVLGGYAEGVLVRTDHGRPTKIEGNPRHPASLGATSVFAQASVLDLWSPDRARAVTERGALRSWDALSDALAAARVQWRSGSGRGLAILTETVTSPTLAAQLAALRAALPAARWCQYEPCHRDAMHAGAKLAFGRPLEVRHHLERARIVVSIDADLLAEGPAALRLAREWMDVRRNARAGERRLYAVHSAPTLTAVAADERLAVRPSLVGAVIERLGRAVGGEHRARRAGGGEALDASARPVGDSEALDPRAEAFIAAPKPSSPRARPRSRRRAARRSSSRATGNRPACMRRCMRSMRRSAISARR
jgi:molybdopterin-containing oxidoreductase family iron-sulfur binding subunit